MCISLKENEFGGLAWVHSFTPSKKDVNVQKVAFFNPVKICFYKAATHNSFSWCICWCAGFWSFAPEVVFWCWCGAEVETELSFNKNNNSNTGPFLPFCKLSLLCPLFSPG